MIPQSIKSHAPDRHLYVRHFIDFCENSDILVGLFVCICFLTIIFRIRLF